MLSEVALSFTYAISTISLRALINVTDRHIFTKDNSDFIKSMALNALFPFIISFAIASWQGAFEDGFLRWLTMPGVLLSALAAQVSAYGFSFSFKKMPVRNVVVSSKLADLFLPLCVFAISHRFNVSEYLFSVATILAFTPIIWDVVRNKEGFYKRLALLLVAIALFQTSINEFLHLKASLDSWLSFSAFMTALFFWRSLFVLLPLVTRSVLMTGKPVAPTKIYYHLLLLRAVVAFSSSACFFVAIIYGSPLITWPVISSGPLVSTFVAHLLLGERIGKPELQALCMFTAVVLVYAFFGSR